MTDTCQGAGNRKQNDCARAVVPLCPETTVMSLDNGLLGSNYPFERYR